MASRESDRQAHRHEPSVRARSGAGATVYKGLGVYYTAVVVLLIALAMLALVAGQLDIAVVVLLMAGAPFTMRLLVRRYAARR